MNIQNATKNDILDTSTNKSADNWHRLLQLQTEMFLPYEICFFLNCLEWIEASSVLDVGCGNGEFISKISDHFPEKSYTAIDVSPELISFAKSNDNSGKITFLKEDFYRFQTEELFDVIIMRLVVQHLSDFEDLLEKVSKRLKPGGSFIIIEPDYKNSWNRPETPKFNTLLKCMDELSVKTKTNRCLLSELDEIADKSDSWSTQRDSLSKVPYLSPKEDSNLLCLYNHWIDIIENSKILLTNLSEIRDELKTWSKRKDAYAQIGIYFLQLKYDGIS